MHRGEVFGDRVRSFAQPWELVLFVWVPGLGLAYACWYEFSAREALVDFRIFRTAAHAVMRGQSPYPIPTAAALAQFDKFVYPPVAALLFAPFTALPSEAGRVLMFAAGLAAIIGALRLLRVEDWRCYSVAIVSAPAINSLVLGALTSLLLLGAAVAWRVRNRPSVVAAATAFTAVLKLFLWPLGIWLLVTRRWRASVLCVAASAVLLFGGWAVIDFAGLGSYPRLVHLLEQVEAPDGYSIVALLGVNGAAAAAATVALSLVAVVAIWLASRCADGDRRAFAMAVVASLFATPLLWLHYLLLLYVPIAVYRPRLSGLWFLPLVLWLTPTAHSHGTAWRIALGLAVIAVVAVRSVSGGFRLSRGAAVPRPAAS